MASAGPKPLTIEEYRDRQTKKPTTPQIPKINKPKRRGGVTQKLKRERAILIREINNKPPPSWEAATEMWNRIDNIDFILKQKLSN